MVMGKLHLWIETSQYVILKKRSFERLVTRLFTLKCVILVNWERFPEIRVCAAHDKQCALKQRIKHSEKEWEHTCQVLVPANPC